MQFGDLKKFFVYKTYENYNWTCRLYRPVWPDMEKENIEIE